MWLQFYILQILQNEKFETLDFVTTTQFVYICSCLFTPVVFVCFFRCCLYTRLLTFARCKSARRGQSFWTWKTMTSTISHTTSLWWHQMVDHEIWAVLNCQFQLRSTTIFRRFHNASCRFNDAFRHTWMSPWKTKTEIKLWGSDRSEWGCVLLAVVVEEMNFNQIWTRISSYFIRTNGVSSRTYIIHSAWFELTFHWIQKSDFDHKSL